MQLRQHHILAIASGLLASSFAVPAPAAAQVLARNLTYTSIQPCRLFDTRVAGGALAANTKRTFKAVNVAAAGSLNAQGGNASGCPIPGFDVDGLPQVQAIVINLAVVTPSGTGVLQAWPSDQAEPTTSVMNFTAAEVVLSNGVVLPVRQDAPGADITLVSNVATQVLGDVVGYFTAGSPVQGAGAGNVFLGDGAGNPSVTTGSFNTAIGSSALGSNTTGQSNTAFGDSALVSPTAGNNNTALGTFALGNTTAGANNISVQAQGFEGYGDDESGNILIANAGQEGDSTAVRIGVGGSGIGQQNTAFIAGITGVTSSSGTEVFVNGGEQLGTTTSSRRFKEDIADMGEASEGLWALRPVTFHYTAAYDDGSHLLQYGLIAEEVARTYPELVEVDQDGRPLAVRYHLVNAMLLNEVQKQHAAMAAQLSQFDRQHGRLEAQEATIARQAAQLAAQRARLDELMAQLAELNGKSQAPR
jgi:Chaperone of endosialidase